MTFFLQCLRAHTGLLWREKSQKVIWHLLRVRKSRGDFFKPMFPPKNEQRGWLSFSYAILFSCFALCTLCCFEGKKAKSNLTVGWQYLFLSVTTLYFLNCYGLVLPGLEWIWGYFEALGEQESIVPVAGFSTFSSLLTRFFICQEL